MAYRDELEKAVMEYSESSNIRFAFLDVVRWLLNYQREELTKQKEVEV